MNNQALFGNKLFYTKNVNSEHENIFNQKSLCFVLHSHAKIFDILLDLKKIQF